MVTLYGDLATWFRTTTVVDNLAALVGSAIERSPAFRDAGRRWVACMRRHGYDYDGPAEHRTCFEKRARALDRDATRRLEIRLAVAEATCARDTGLGETVRA